MKRSASLSFFLAILSVVSGFLLSQVSWIGETGISLFYQEYGFLKTWWKGALLVFAVLVFLFAIQAFVQRFSSLKVSRPVHFIALIAAASGLIFSFLDFRNDFSHRLLGESFHIGVYLFWVGWMVISIYFLLIKKNLKAMQKDIGVEV